MMPTQDTKILELNQYQEFDEALFLIYADIECLIEKLMDVFRILKRTRKKDNQFQKEKK